MKVIRKATFTQTGINMNAEKRYSQWSTQRRKYERWWLGKRCRLDGSTREFRLVVRVEMVGPPSFVYGDVWLHYDDGDREHVFHGEAFRPRKADVQTEGS